MTAHNKDNETSYDCNEELPTLLSKDWEYLNEGNLHMCFFNNTRNKDSILQDRLLKVAKTVEIKKTSREKLQEGIFGAQFNRYFLDAEQLAPYVTREKPVRVDPSESPDEFIEDLMKNAEGKRAECRQHQKIDVGARMSYEKNLLFISDHMNNKLDQNKENMIMFHVEIKPKFCKDEIPKFRSIKSLLDVTDKGQEIDQRDFYNKLFKNAPLGQRKFVFRKSVATKKKIWKQFNPTDFFSDKLMVRAKSIRALLKEDWGYLRIFDKEKNMIPHKDILQWFRQFDPKLTYKAIALIIASSIDQKLIVMVANMQELFPMNPSEIITLRTRVEKSKHHVNINTVKHVMANLREIWLSDPQSPEFLAQKKGYSREFDTEDYLPLIAFLISLTARDCSFLLRVGISKQDNNFDLVEKWEEQDMKVIETSVSNNIYNDSLQLKNNFPIKDDSDVAYWIKGRNHIIDVGLKDWHKLYEVVRKNRDVNRGYVEHYLDTNFNDFKRKESGEGSRKNSRSSSVDSKSNQYDSVDDNTSIDNFQQISFKKYSNCTSLDSPMKLGFRDRLDSNDFAQTDTKRPGKLQIDLPQESNMQKSTQKKNQIQTELIIN